ncbi:glutamyl-tRNA reductase [Micrococcoides hystricis]|uniref:Glutamyl-tRNA reductase n=1 Tax=Micrococcoides hystricis TaxID=1572761 RepID=A0ABV6P8I1_9MICC
MVFFSLIASHTKLDLETVAQLSTGADRVLSCLPEDNVVRGGVVLATCNRYELYIEAQGSGPDAVQTAATQVYQAISVSCGIAYEIIVSAFTLKISDEAVRHLFEVGAGLNSAVVGEREIAGQVRRALSEAQEKHTATGHLNRLFESVTRTAKEVGAKTELGAQGRSVVSVALDLTEDLATTERFWPEAKIVLIGTGAYAGTAMAQLRSRGAQHISVHSSSGRAADFVADRGGFALDDATLPDAVAEADVLIGCSGGERRLSLEQLQQVRGTQKHPLAILDLALSHDFDPAVAQLPGVELITLESVKNAAPQSADAALMQAQAIVERAIGEFLTELRERTATDAIVALREHTHEVLENEMAKVRSRHGCTAAAQEVEFALRHLVRELLHVPTIRAKELAASGRAAEYVAALESLYNIDQNEIESRAERRKALAAAKKRKALENKRRRQRLAEGKSCPTSTDLRDSATG